jgi:hypothetical protein
VNAPYLSVPCSPSITIDAALGTKFSILLTGDVVMEFPDGVRQTGGSIVELRLIQDEAGGHVVTLPPAAWRFGPDVPSQLSTAPHTSSYVLAKYHELDDVMDVVAVVKGYSDA